MDKAELKSSGKPDEVRDFPRGHLELVKSAMQPSGELSLNLARDGQPRSNLLPRQKVTKRRIS